MPSASAGIGSRKNICHKYGQRDKPLRPVPLVFCLDFESIFLVYGGATLELLPMIYSSSSGHDEIRFSSLINIFHGDSLPAPA